MKYMLLILYITTLCINIYASNSNTHSPTTSPALTQQHIEDCENNLKIHYAILAQEGNASDAHSALCEQALVQKTTAALSQSTYLTYTAQIGRVQILKNNQGNATLIKKDEKQVKEYIDALNAALIDGLGQDLHDISNIEKIILKRHNAITKKQMYRAGAGGFVLALGIVYAASYFWPKFSHKIKAIYT